jgi:hypothetical protein
LWLALWAKPVMEVTITVSAEGEEPVEVYRSRTPVVGGAERRHAVESEIDLGRWEGRLVRLDVRGEVRAPGPLPLQRGRIACSAALEGPDGAQILEFVGWENDGSWPVHFGRIGCPTPAGGPARSLARCAQWPSWKHTIHTNGRYVVSIGLEALRCGRNPLTARLGWFCGEATGATVCTERNRA